MALDFEVGQGQTLPAVSAVVPGTWAGTETVTFRLRRPGTFTWTSLAGGWVNASAGTVAYDWQAGDTDTAGYYLAEFVVAGTSVVASVPLVGLVRGLAYDPAGLGIVGVEEIAFAKGRDLDPPEVRFLEQQLPRILNALETRLNRTIGLKTVVGERHVVEYSTLGDLPTGGGWWTNGRAQYVPLRVTPVYAITTVTVDAVALPAIAYEQQRSGLNIWRWMRSELNPLPAVVVVDYQGGLDVPTHHPILPSAREAITQLAVRRLDRFVADDAAGVSSLNVAGYSTSYLDSDWTPGELNNVMRYRRRIAS